MKKSMKKTTKLIATLSLMFLFACGGGESKEVQNVKNSISEIDSNEKKWEEFQVDALGNTMSEMRYSTKSITVKEGSWVRVILTNKGVDNAMLHNIAFIKYGTRKQVAMEAVNNFPSEDFVKKNENIIAYSAVANPGESITLEFRAPAKGNYEFLCTYPGHAEIMRGYFFVK